MSKTVWSLIKYDNNREVRVTDKLYDSREKAIVALRDLVKRNVLYVTGCKEVHVRLLEINDGKYSLTGYGLTSRGMDYTTVTYSVKEHEVL